ncbi:MAG: LptF/LptG family permease [Zetaproteobacteria bacterium]|nr:LptF/LptG family permease [Zetaproteobacteria bacterium]
MIYRYILREIAPNIFTTLVMFCTVIVISQLLRLSEVLVAFGLSLENLLFPFLYIVVPFISIITPMSFLFGAVIGLSRLNSDGELTAIQAAGGGLWRIVRSLAFLATLIAGVSILAGVYLEGWGRREFIQFIYKKTQTELDNMLRYRVQPGVFVENFLGYTLYTEEISADRTEYQKVMLSPGNSSSAHFVILCPKARITGSVSESNLMMELFDGVSYAHTDSTIDPTVTSLRFKRLEIDLLRVFREKILGDGDSGDDYRGFTFTQLREAVHTAQAKGEQQTPLYRKMAYLYYSRFLNPLIVIFFLFSSILVAYRNTRKAGGNSYFSATGVIMVAYIFIVASRWLVENAYLPVLTGITLPLLTLSLGSGLLFYVKAKLPPSESLVHFFLPQKE